mmetsp:Transcript_19536/g.50008  ORF Transcript_19536/g.50008 Transcript_19536/m.50008 type:complete len:213 (-) Transcript_19536:47-685(-)
MLCVPYMDAAERQRDNHQGAAPHREVEVQAQRATLLRQLHMPLLRPPQDELQILVLLHLCHHLAAIFPDAIDLDDEVVDLDLAILRQRGVDRGGDVVAILQLRDVQRDAIGEVNNHPQLLLGFVGPGQRDAELAPRRLDGRRGVLEALDRMALVRDSTILVAVQGHLVVAMDVVGVGQAVARDNHHLVIGLRLRATCAKHVWQGVRALSLAR